MSFTLFGKTGSPTPMWWIVGVLLLLMILLSSCGHQPQVITKEKPVPILPPADYLRPCIPADLTGVVYDELGLFLKLCDEDKHRLRQWRDAARARESSGHDNRPAEPP